MTDRSDRPIDESSSRASDALRARLHVDPLDEVTRARLVRNALAAEPAVTEGPVAPGSAERSHRPVRWLAAAAAVVAVLAVGVSVLVRDSNAPQTTASAPAAKSADEQEEFQEFDRGADSSSNESDAAPSASALDAQAAIPSLGKLGEVGRRNQLRAAVKTAPATGRFTPACPTPDVGSGGAGDVLISGGTGTVDGKPASVYVVEGPDGANVAVAVIDAGCRTAVIVNL